MTFVVLLFDAVLLIDCIMQKSCGQQLKWESSLFSQDHAYTPLFVSGFLNAMKFQFTYYAFSCNLLVFLFPVLKILFTGMLAVIHFPSQLETFLLISLASQPCKIPCYKFFF